jgi:hypothetical protein
MPGTLVKGQHVVPTADPSHPVMVIYQFLAYGIAECAWKEEKERKCGQFKPEDLTVLTADEISSRIEPRKCAGCGKPFNVDKHTIISCCRPQCYIDARRIKDEEDKVAMLKRIQEASKR